MPRYVVVSAENIEWLKANHSRSTYTAMASKLGCHVDTLKRILAREGLQEFEAAKYTAALKHPKWTRPCILCSKPETRPRNWFMCSSCRKKNGYEET